ncbi:hypothetical protein KQR54_18155 [Mycobacterium gordonae]|nr:hypothetical protein [Mycobacterium gordonae]
MQLTTNLSLKKPEGSDVVDIADFNGNADILDAQVTQLASGTLPGRMTAAQFTKLAGIATGANAYVHPNHAGDVTSTGDGVTAIAPGVIVNADVNANAAIDVSKIGTGVVSNTEFAYLDGVTSAIQTQLDAKSPLASPALTGNPTAPTQTAGNNSTRIATTAYVDGAVSTHNSDYIRQPGYGTTAGAANTFTLSLSPALGAYVDGVAVAVKIHAANTGASTININGLGAKSILDSKGNALTSGKIALNSVYTLRYNGTAFILQGEGGEYGNAVAADVLIGHTIGTDAGLVNGTMPDRAGDTAALASSVSGTTLKLRASNGYRDGVDDNVTITDADFIAANILSGKDIFGLVGTLEQGRKVATGFTATDSQYNFIADGGSTTSRYALTITGLSFQPRALILFNVGGGFSGGGSTDPTFPKKSGFNIFWSGFEFRIDGSLTYFSGSGFRVPAPTTGSYYWIAYE